MIAATWNVFFIFDSIRFDYIFRKILWLLLLLSLYKAHVNRVHGQTFRIVVYYATAMSIYKQCTKSVDSIERIAHTLSSIQLNCSYRYVHYTSYTLFSLSFFFHYTTFFACYFFLLVQLSQHDINSTTKKNIKFWKIFALSLSFWIDIFCSLYIGHLWVHCFIW